MWRGIILKNNKKNVTSQKQRICPKVGDAQCIAGASEPYPPKLRSLNNCTNANVTLRTANRIQSLIF